MDYAQVRELIRIRHDLRRATAEGRREEARALLERLRAVSQHDPVEAAAVQTELIRWESTIGV